MLDVVGTYAVSWPLVHVLSVSPGYTQKRCVLSLHCVTMLQLMAGLPIRFTGRLWFSLLFHSH